MKKSGLFFGILLIVFLANNIYAQKLGVEIKEGNAERVAFIATVYDDNNNRIDGNIEYLVQDYYTDPIFKGNSLSGEEVILNLPKNPKQGPWKVGVKYDNIEANELFEVGKLEKVDIKLEQDNLIIENLGNIPYDRNILIYIGENHQTARVNLEVSQTKKIKLTAPPGDYTVKVNDGSEENNKVFSGVTLTGNVVGLEGVSEGSFWQRYPAVGLFLVTLLVAAVVISVIKFSKKNDYN